MADALLNGNHYDPCFFTVYMSVKIPKESACKSGEAVDARSFESITSPVYYHQHTGVNFMQMMYHTVVWLNVRSRLQSDGCTGPLETLTQAGG